MEYIVDKEFENVRLDRFLRKTCANNNLSEIFEAIRKKYVRVNGKKTKENYRLQLNDIIKIHNLVFFYETKLSKQIDKNLIVYEDEDICIINKPKFMAMHKGTNTKKGLAEIYNIDFANRLDKKTSGLVIACKNKESLRKMTELIRENKIVKKYRAKTNNNGKYNINDKIKVDTQIDGKKSLTYFTLVDKSDENYIFDIELKTGRKHQIRKHFLELGLCIIGDDKYGKYKKEDKLELECYYLKIEEKVFEI